MSTPPEITLTEGDLATIATLYNQAKSIAAGGAPAEDARLTRAFDTVVSRTMADLAAALDAEQDTYARTAAIQAAKLELLELLANCVVAATHVAAPQIAGMVTGILNAQQQALAATPAVLTAAGPHYASANAEPLEAARKAADSFKSTARNAMQRAKAAEQETQRIRDQLAQEQARHDEEVHRLRAALADAGGVLRTLGQRKSSPGKQPPAASHRHPASAPITEAQGSPRGSPARQGVRSSPSSPASSAGQGRQLPSNGVLRSGSSAPTSAHASGLVPRPRGAEPPTFTPAPPRPAPPRSSPADSIPQHISAATMDELAEDAPDAMLPLKKLKEDLASIWASKLESDTRAEDARLPQETLEQHLYTWLATRYGLRRLVVQQAATILRSIAQHANTDADVRVFRAVLRREVDEGFMDMANQLQSTVRELLRRHLRVAHPFKSEADLEDMVVVREDTHVRESEWGDIIQYMYATEDAAALSKIIHTAIRERSDWANPPSMDAAAVKAAAAAEIPATGRPGAKARAAKSRERVDQQARLREHILATGRISYQSFVQVLLDFQLRGHQKFLGPLRRAWRAADSDSDGVVDEQGFKAVATALDVPEHQLHQLLNEVDPWNGQCITFTQAAAALADRLTELAAEAAAAATSRPSPTRTAPAAPSRVPPPSPSVGLGGGGGGGSGSVPSAATYASDMLTAAAMKAPPPPPS